MCAGTCWMHSRSSGLLTDGVRSTKMLHRRAARQLVQRAPRILEVLQHAGRQDDVGAVERRQLRQRGEELELVGAEFAPPGGDEGGCSMTYQRSVQAVQKGRHWRYVLPSEPPKSTTFRCDHRRARRASNAARIGNGNSAVEQTPNRARSSAAPRLNCPSRMTTVRGCWIAGIPTTSAARLAQSAGCPAKRSARRSSGG